MRNGMFIKLVSSFGDICKKREEMIGVSLVDIPSLQLFSSCLSFLIEEALCPWNISLEEWEWSHHHPILAPFCSRELHAISIENEL